jgi:CBS domain-containing protein
LLGYSCFPVVNKDNLLVGMITKHQYQLLEVDSVGDKLVSEFMIKRDKLIIVKNPNITIDEATDQMQTTGMISVFGTSGCPLMFREFTRFSIILPL